MDKDNIIEIENLIFEYIREENSEPVRAVGGVSLKIEEGSFTAILGKNGSGKSTLAKNLNGLLVPTEGVVYVNVRYMRRSSYLGCSPDGRYGISKSG